MKKKITILFFLLSIAVGIPIHLSAQKDTSKTPDEIFINGKRYKATEDKKAEIIINKNKSKSSDSSFIINNKKFQYYNNWLTGGIGGQQNLTYKRELGFAGGLDFNFHIKHHYFQAGILVSGEHFGVYNNYQFHLGYGKRFEDKDYHFAAFMGVSYASGTQVIQIDSVKSSRTPYHEPGLYLQGEIVKKITYDVGLGVSLFADWNQEQSMIGMRFILYFSGAYLGKKNKEYEE